MIQFRLIIKVSGIAEKELDWKDVNETGFYWLQLSNGTRLRLFEEVTTNGYFLKAVPTYSVLKQNQNAITMHSKSHRNKSTKRVSKN